MKGEKVNMTLENATGLLYLAHKYMVQDLKQICYDYIYLTFDPENFESIFHICNMLGNKDFESKILLYYRLNALEILQSKSFENISKAGVARLVSLDKVNIREIIVFMACMRWVDVRIEAVKKERELESSLFEEFSSKNLIKYLPLPSRRSLLGEKIVKNIRYPTMTMKEFGEVMKYKDILSNKETLEIKHCIKKATKLCWMGTLSYPRQSLWEVCVDRSDTMREKDEQKVPVNDLTFETKSGVFLSGLGVYGRKDMNRVEIKVSKTDALISVKQPILEVAEGIRSNLATPHKITFEKPIKLQAYKKYEVKVVYFKDRSEQPLEAKTDKTAGGPYKKLHLSKNCEDFVFHQPTKYPEFYSNIPHIYYIKL